MSQYKLFLLSFLTRYPTSIHHQDDRKDSCRHRNWVCIRLVLSHRHIGIDPSSYSFSGLCSAIRLKQELDIQVDLFEINNDVAGTWQNNRYWGAACDIPSHLYSLSFELNPSMWFFPFFSTRVSLTVQCRVDVSLQWSSRDSSLP